MSFLQSLFSRPHKDSYTDAERAQKEADLIDAYNRRINELMKSYEEKKADLANFRKARDEEICRARDNLELSPGEAKRKFETSEIQFHQEAVIAYNVYDHEIDNLLNERDQRLAILRHSFKRARS